MGTIISKQGSRIYNYSKQILRTPLYKNITITPKFEWYYDVGDTYVQQYPTRDFYTVGTSGNFAVQAGHKMRKAYLLRSLPTGAYQIWRQINQEAPDTGFVWYQGNYSTAYGQTGGAAFIRVPGYKCEIPSTYNGWKVESGTLTMKDHGPVLTSGKTTERKTDSNKLSVHPWNANTRILETNSTWRNKTAYMSVGVFNQNTLKTTAPCNLYGQCQQELTINLQNTDAISNVGGSNGYPLWVSWSAASYSDGAIINAPTNPHLQIFELNQNMVSAINNVGTTFYVPIICNVGDSGKTTYTEGQDFPDYHFTTSTSTTFPQNWWMCERYQLQSISLKLKFGED